MKKIFILTSIILFSIIANGQLNTNIQKVSQDYSDTVRLNHINYISVFSKSKMYPVMVQVIESNW
jgi:hypothetical protein